jgi:hypothetical protein
LAAGHISYAIDIFIAASWLPRYFQNIFAIGHSFAIDTPFSPPLRHFHYVLAIDIDIISATPYTFDRILIDFAAFIISHISHWPHCIAPASLQITAEAVPDVAIEILTLKAAYMAIAIGLRQPQPRQLSTGFHFQDLRQAIRCYAAAEDAPQLSALSPFSAR